MGGLQPGGHGGQKERMKRGMVEENVATPATKHPTPIHSTSVIAPGTSSAPMRADRSQGMKRSGDPQLSLCSKVCVACVGADRDLCDRRRPLGSKNLQLFSENIGGQPKTVRFK